MIGNEGHFRECINCHALFDGREGGACPANGEAHVKNTEHEFALDVAARFGGSEVPSTPTAQSGWRICNVCQVLYFDTKAHTNPGDPFGQFDPKGACDAGGQHNAESAATVFMVQHDRSPFDQGLQRGWEFCLRCHGLFRDTGGRGGNCSAGGEHLRHPDAFRFSVMIFVRP